MTTIPRFPGWKTEDAMNINEWSKQNGRIIHLEPSDKKLDSQFISEILNKMEMEFGVQDDYKNAHVYLAVYDSKIAGLATVVDNPQATFNGEKMKTRVGVQRLFVRTEFRRKGVARTLLKTIVIMHEKGELLDIRNDVAFSSPTEDGKKLIINVIGTGIVPVIDQ